VAKVVEYFLNRSRMVIFCEKSRKKTVKSRKCGGAILFKNRLLLLQRDF
jgi:hypothetical protein